MSSGLFYSIKNFILQKKEKNIIIDPFSCLIKLALLNYQEEGTKISIIENKIFFNQPIYGQGIIRFLYGDGREDLHNLFNPIQKSVIWFSNSKVDMLFIFNQAISGLKCLKKSYSQFATIQHTIDYYISIINDNLNIYNNNDDNQNDKNNQNYVVSEEPKLAKTKKNKYIKNNDTDKNDENVNNLDINNSLKLNNSLDLNSSIDDTNELNNLDTSKFLKRLWTDREINIIINLFKEYRNKKSDDDKKYVFDSIMNYCKMKEEKLNKYIEEKSSIL
tara:strand:+ start:758 stop:1582 length:825 start_codon:yes stop_codon:yes gene_type:complete